MKTTFAITGMHCPMCVQRLTEVMLKVPGVVSALVTLEPPRVVIESEGPVPVEALDRAARVAGSYAVVGVDASAAPTNAQAATVKRASLYPLFLIVGYIAGTCLISGYVRGVWSWHVLMNDFMAGFFLVFSFFKLLDLRGFADAYGSYDLIARRSRAYAFAYPFIELALGVAYLMRFEPTITNAVTLVLMLVGSAGVLRALLNKRAIRCACLGTALALPMTTVTLVEDLGMAAMAATGLIFSR